MFALQSIERAIAIDSSSFNMVPKAANVLNKASSSCSFEMIVPIVKSKLDFTSMEDSDGEVCKRAAKLRMTVEMATSIFFHCEFFVNEESVLVITAVREESMSSL